jgi:hypothetical protein
VAVNDWIDALCALWEISDGKGGQVYSYRVYEKAEFPEAITKTPCALTYTTGVQMEIQAGDGRSYWKGMTEFHLMDNVDKQHFPQLMLYFARIRAAMASSHTLGGLVSHFKPDPDVAPHVQGPVVLQYGSDDPHHGIVVFWEVKENETDALSP